MIERAQRSAEEAGIGQIEFCLGNAEDMPVESGTAYVVLPNCVLHLFGPAVLHQYRRGIHRLTSLC
jgi:ubiquinone/menaquinone biosynthesis C-methylase UbiE